MKKTPADAQTATEKEAAPKAAPKSKRMPILDYIAKLDGDDEEGEGESENEDGGEGKIKRILRLYIAGYSRSEIVKEAGFNPSTVYRQTAEYNKLKKAPALKMQGFDLYEARILRMMSNKKVTREKAIEIIAEKDAED
jgi:hypothetical protein